MALDYFGPVTVPEFKKPLKPSSSMFVKKCHCRGKKIIGMYDTSNEQSPIEVQLNHHADLRAFIIAKLSTAMADFKILGMLVEHVIGPENVRILPDEKFFPLARAYFASFLRLHPPCDLHTFPHYLELLEKHFEPVFIRMSIELELVAKGALPEKPEKRKNKARVSEDYEYTKEYLNYIETLKEEEMNSIRKSNQLYPQERLSLLFNVFNFFVDILEKDLQVWRQRGQSSRSYRPLLVQLLWNGISRFDLDALTNKIVRKIFKFYAEVWHNNIKLENLQSIAKLISLINKMVEIIAGHQHLSAENTLNLESDFKNLVFCSPQHMSEDRCGPLKAIENGRERRKPSILFMDENNRIGFLTAGFSRTLATCFEAACTCENEKCRFSPEAVMLLKPAWSRLQVTSRLLKQGSSLAEVGEAARQAMDSDGQNISARVRKLRSIRFRAAHEVFQTLGYRTKRVLEDVHQIKRTKLNPIEDVVSLVKSQTV